ncbi:hypothetical protein [Flectobacillus roseus]|uniref:DUF2846 domain-containing protein n=1 Tax=Flectobacillus roseus TaxID=502259 RepID=A0ABT6Y8U3_9BACT|nr:hypothetical protein [Flectobacillus roseus]MDI9859528.1 hypothetical protein [Flectobacillus roseus]
MSFYIKIFYTLVWASLRFTSTDTPKAKLFILREREFWGSSVSIIIQGKKIAELSQNRYIEIELPAESTVIEISRNIQEKIEVKAVITLEANKTYYLKVYRELDYFKDQLMLGRLGTQSALQELKHMKKYNFSAIP